MKFEPQRIWEGHPVVLVGGGPSLIGFDFSVLENVRTIVCNDAFKLGHPIVDVALFCDTAWFESNKRDISNHWTDSGIMFTSVNPQTYEMNLPWLHAFRKETKGWNTDGKISMNRSTGAAAIHLAWMMGASEVFLLGYDCGFKEKDKPRWHSYNPKPMKEQSVQVFQNGFNDMEEGRKKVAPEFKITNVVKGDSSKLDHFEKIQMSEFLSNPIITKEVPSGSVSQTPLSEATRTFMDED